jgi:hypothetical protein
VPNGSLSIPRPAIEVEPFFSGPNAGDRTQSMRILQESYDQRKLTLTLEGQAGSDAQLPLVINVLNLALKAEGANLPTASDAVAHVPGSRPTLRVHFPPGEGWKTITVILTW